MMDSVAPIWDGNETWLVLGGIGLFAAFPLAFAIIIPALYFPILVMLLGLIFRGVAFEFRRRRERQPRTAGTARSSGARWSPRSRRAACSGSSCSGFEVERPAVRRHAAWDWLAPFVLAVGVGLVVRLRAARRDLARA